MTNENLVSIIILTHNSKNFIKQCLESVTNQDYENFELIVVDNNSTDGTKKLLSEINLEKSISVKIILNSTNLGYNLGNQVGIENAKGNFIGIVNPDVKLAKSWLQNIMNTLTNKQEVVAASGRFFNSKGEIKSTGGIMDIYGAVRQRNQDEVESKSFFYIPGSAFVFRRDVLSKINLDPNLFMYYDDVDFTWQARLLNYEIGYCENADAVHFEGHSLSTLTPSKFYYIAKNRIYICTKNYSSNRIIRRIFQINFLVFLDSLYYSIKFKSPRYFLAGIKAWLWNLTNFKKLRIERKKIQRQRNVSDSDLEKNMYPKSIEYGMKNQIIG